MLRRGGNSSGWASSWHKIEADDLENGAVSADKLATGSVTGTKVADKAITTRHLVDASVTNAKIDWSTVYGNWRLIGATTASANSTEVSCLCTTTEVAKYNVLKVLYPGRSASGSTGAWIDFRADYGNSGSTTWSNKASNLTTFVSGDSFGTYINNGNVNTTTTCICEVTIFKAPNSQVYAASNAQAVEIKQTAAWCSSATLPYRFTISSANTLGAGSAVYVWGMVK